MFVFFMGAAVVYIETRPAAPPPPKRGEITVAKAPDGSIGGRWQSPGQLVQALEPLTSEIAPLGKKDQTRAMADVSLSSGTNPAAFTEYFRLFAVRIGFAPSACSPYLASCPVRSIVG
jgi:hypothetical protein